MKDPVTVNQQLLDLPYAPETEALLDELERTGQFRIGAEAENDDAADPAPSNDYSFGRGSGRQRVLDWWTTGRVTLHVGAGLRPTDLALTREADSLILSTADGRDQLELDGYLGLIPDASTLRLLFADGPEWSGQDVLGQMQHSPRSSASAPNH